MVRFRDNLTQVWYCIQETLFPWLAEELGELTQKQRQLVTVLEMIQLENFIHRFKGCPGRPVKDRAAIARAFVAKAVYNLPTTRQLLDRLDCNIVLRRICGWERRRDVPDESTFSRAFAEFSASCLPVLVHEALIKGCYGNEIVGHISRDATEIEARERPAVKPAAEEKPPAKRGHPKKGEQRPKPPTRLEKQADGMTLEAMLEDLPAACDIGCNKNSKGYKARLEVARSHAGWATSCTWTSPTAASPSALC